MARKKKPATPFANLSQDTRTKLARWVADQIHDMEVDADSIAEAEGADFMPALRGMVDYLREPHEPPK